MSVALRVLTTQALLSYRSVFPWSDPVSYIANVIARPVFTVAMLALAGRFALGDDVARDYAIGGAAFAATWTLSGGIVQGFWVERARGTLAVLFVTTGSRLQLYATRGLMHLPNGAVSAIATLIAALVFAGVPLGGANWPAVAMSFAALLVSVMAFGLFLGNFAIAFREWIVVRATGQMLVMAFCGVFVPRRELPDGLDHLGSVLPVTHGLEALRKALDGAALSEALYSVGLEMVIALLYLGGGYLGFRLLETTALRSGRYDQGQA